MYIKLKGNKERWEKTPSIFGWSYIDVLRETTYKNSKGEEVTQYDVMGYDETPDFYKENVQWTQVNAEELFNEQMNGNYEVIEWDHNW